MTYKGKGGIQYELSPTPLAAGGEGEIYAIIGRPDLVAKLYKEGKASLGKECKLIRMVDFPPDASVLSQIAWPRDVLYQADQFMGFVMQKMDINDDLNIIYEYGAASKYPDMPWENRIIIAQNLCAVLDSVHTAGHICGDLNPKNISVNPHTGHITLLDTDSYHIQDGNVTYRCDVGIPEYLPVEIQRKMQSGTTLSTASLPTFTQDTDNFALAVHIFQLLMNGVHPFACAIIPSQSSVVAPAPQPLDNISKGKFPFLQNTPGIKIPVYAPKIDILPKEIQELFRRAFIGGNKTPDARPHPAEWHKALSNLRNNLTVCSIKNHHQYFSSLKACPWCGVDIKYNATLTSSSSPRLTQIHIKPPPASGTFTTAPQNQHYSSPFRPGQTVPPIQPLPPPRPPYKKKTALLVTCWIVIACVAGYFGLRTFFDNNNDTPADVPSVVSSSQDVTGLASEQANNFLTSEPAPETSEPAPEPTDDRILLGRDVKAYQSTWGYEEADYVTIGGNEQQNALIFSTFGVISDKVEAKVVDYNLSKRFTHLSGFAGHVDGSRDWDMSINFYGDGKIIGTVNLKPDDYSKEIDIDVTDVIQLSFEIIVLNSTGSSTKYAFFDMILTESDSMAAETAFSSIDANTVVLGRDVKAYQSTWGFEEMEYVSIGGIEHQNAIKFSTFGKISDRIEDNLASYNLGGRYTRLSGFAGHVDGSRDWDMSINFYGDGKIIGTVDLKPNNYSKEIDIDVTDVAQLSFEIIVLNSTSSSTEYALYNMVLTDREDLVEIVTPEVPDRNSDYLGSDIKGVAGWGYSEANNVLLGGQNFFYGLIFDKDASAQYNLGNAYSSLEGVVGHVDGTANEDATFIIYGDGQQITTISVTPSDFGKPISLDVQGVDTLTIELTANRSTSYAFANMKLN